MPLCMGGDCLAGFKNAIPVLRIFVPYTGCQAKQNSVLPERKFVTYFAMTLIATRSPVVRDRPLRTLAKLPLPPYKSPHELRKRRIKTTKRVSHGHDHLLANHRLNLVVGLNIGRVDTARCRATIVRNRLDHLKSTTLCLLRCAFIITKSPSAP